MKQYDAEQQRAIMAEGGYHLVLASPGCGKTDILAERMAVAAERGVPLSQMLCLTFTNRAARGMRERVAERIGKAAEETFIGNIHRYCANYIFASNSVPASTGIIDEQDMTDIVTDMDPDFFTTKQGMPDKTKLTDVENIDAYILQRKLHQPKTSIYLPDTFEAYYQLAVDANFDFKQLAPEHRLLGYALKYHDYKREHNIISFSDILILAYESLRNNTDRPYYSWIQVDEVQDLNALQTAIVDELTDHSQPFTIMFLGDEQQAIFSFLGAKLDQLQLLKQRCQGNIMTLGRNYRSPNYLLKVFNTFAEKELGVATELLPTSSNDTPRDRNDLILTKNNTSDDETNRILRMTQFYLKQPNERLAILVPTNVSADKISRALLDGGVSNFKISGTDMFKTKGYKTLAAVFAVIINDFNFLSWGRLLYGTGAIASQPLARRMMAKTRQLMMTPSDLLRDKPYLADFCEHYANEEIVFFDTETTGLNPLSDDIVQIAAYKVKQGHRVEGSDLNIFIETDKEIPATLGAHVNPLVEEYAASKHYSHTEGLQMFLDYIGNDHVLGHNVDYDYSILKCNVSRYLHKDIHLQTWDSLHIIKCVEPYLPMYKLEYLLKELHLEGKNSHLANEDIDATKSVVDYCYDKAQTILPEQQAFLTNTKMRQIIKRMDKIKSILQWLNMVKPLSTKGTNAPTLARALKTTYDAMLKDGIIDDLGYKFNIFLNYIDHEWTIADEETTFAEMLSRHINDITVSINEGDLVSSTDVINERVFVMTVHKGKGLEFENVIILGANDGTYPFYTSNKVLAIPHHYTAAQVERARQERREDARKFYVAISRAKRRLCVSYSMRNTYGRDTRCTPFMDCIKDQFFTF